MKSITTKQIARSLAGLGMVVLGSSAFAATSWNQDLTGTLSGMSVSGLSTGTGTPAAPTVGTSFAAAPIAVYSGAGLGVIAVNENSGLTGPHAIDNGYGIDALQINFTSAVNLSSLTLGWAASTTTANGDGSYTTDNNGGTTGGGTSVTYNDSDLSVFYLSASSAWTLLGNYADVKKTVAQSLGTTIYSSSWLISAYSSTYGGTTNSSGVGTLTDGNDAFKVLSIAGNFCSGTVTKNACGTTPSTNVPEPGSLALIGAAMAGFVATRRRKSKAV